MSKGIIWTREQGAILEKMAEKGFSARAISAAVGRNQQSVFRKASYLDIKIGPHIDRYAATAPTEFHESNIVDAAKLTLSQAGWTSLQLRCAGLDTIMREANIIRKRAGKTLLGRKPEWIEGV